jgi:hypothetical protein
MASDVLFLRSFLPSFVLPGREGKARTTTATIADWLLCLLTPTSLNSLTRKHLVLGRVDAFDTNVDNGCIWYHVNLVEVWLALRRARQRFIVA